MRRKNAGTETALVRQIMDYLRLRKMWVYRQNTGGMYNPGGRYVAFGTPGAPDIVARSRTLCACCGASRNILIEVKSKKGTQTEKQKDWQVKAEKHGDIYILARKIEDVMCLFERTK